MAKVHLLKSKVEEALFHTTSLSAQECGTAALLIDELTFEQLDDLIKTMQFIAKGNVK